MASNEQTSRYYPALSNILSISDLPDTFRFISDEVNDLLSKIFYKDFQKFIGPDGSTAFYSLSIVSLKKLEVEIPGTNIFFVLNYDIDDTIISTFPVTVFWQWDIIKLLNTFDVSKFSFEPIELLKLALNLFNIKESQLLELVINSLTIPSEQDISKFEQLVNDINSFLGTEIVVPTDIYTLDDTYPSHTDDDDIEADDNIIADDVHSQFTLSNDKFSQLKEELDLIGQDITSIVFAIYILQTDLTQSLAKLNTLLSSLIPNDVLDYFRLLIIPKARVTLELTAALEFPRDMLLPMAHNPDGSFTPDMTTDGSGNLKKSYIQFGDAILDVETSTGFGYQTDFSGTLFPQYAQIGNTCLLISFTDIKLDLSQTTNIPEADAAGYPVDFVGAYVKEASVIINGFGKESTAHESVSLAVQNFLVGSGGVTGTITLASDGVLYRDFGDFAAELDKFSITFRQGSIVDSAISGKITLPSGFQDDGQPSIVQIDGHIMDNGDFSITGTFLGEQPAFTFPNVFTVAISKLELGEKDGHFYLSVAGKLDFIADIPVLGQVLPKDIIINKLIIWDDGHIEFEGGKLTVPKAFRLNIGPVSLEVSELTLAPYKRMHNGIERNYNYIGFDGMLNAGNAGIGVGGNGLKYYFTNDNGPSKPFDQFLSIDGIEIDLSIPAHHPNFILHGFLSMKNPDGEGKVTETEYVGRISVSLPKLRIAGSAAMRLKPDVPSFIVDMDLELPTAIPLGPTGLGIYGFRGLIGQHYSPSKTAAGLTEDATWWDYYKAPSAITHREGVEIDKFDDQKQGFSLGIGASIATRFDTGYIFSSKVFLMLGLPDVFLIQGQAAIISKRLGLDDDRDPPFSALIVISDQSVMGDLGVDFNLPNDRNHPQDKGWIVSLKAQLEMAFFFNNASGWYLNIGKDTPATAMVQASLLTIFKGHFYLMISTQGIKAGAGIAYDFHRKFGPVQVGFGAALDMGGFISFQPVQIGGFIQVSGYAYLKVWKFKFGLSIAIALAMEAPHPFNITGSLKVKLNLPWPIPDIKFTLDVSWHFNNDQDLTQVPILSLPDPEAGYLPAAGVNILSNESFPVNYVTSEDLATIPPPGDPAWKYDFTNETDVLNVIIPLDTFVDIELLKPVMPGNAQIGGSSSQLPAGYKELVPPVKGVKAQVKHQYELKELGVYAWDDAGAAWVAYNVYEAVTAIVNSNTGDNAIDLSQLKPGYWQFADKDKYNKIRLLSQNMFSFSNGTLTDQLDLDALGFRQGDLFCFDEVFKTSVVNWKDVPADTAYPDDVPVPAQALNLTFSGLAARIKQEASFTANSLFLDGGDGTVTIVFPEPVANVKLEFGDNANNVTVDFIEPVYQPGDFGQAIFTDTVLSTSALAATQQNGVITYDDANQPISKVKLTMAAAIVSGYTGNLVLGGHLQLPAANIPAGLYGELEMDRALLFAALYDRSFTAQEVLTLEHNGQAGLVGQWPMNSPAAGTGSLNGIITGSPGIEDGFYQTDSPQLGLSSIYRLTANEDGLIIPNAAAINIENGSFTAEVTAAFNPFAAGIGTLLYKVTGSSEMGNQKGYAIHLVQATPAHAFTRYAAIDAIPEFTILFTCYKGAAVAAVAASERYTIDCAGSTVAEKQYKRVLVSVNRETGKLEIYIDRVLKTSVDIPSELDVTEAPEGNPFTYLNQITYTTETMQARQADNPITNTGFINEAAVLDDTINKTIQPVWRPDTTFAVRVKTFDRVNNTSNEQVKTHIFGFRTKGPLGHYHQYSKAYQELAANDQQDAFKLANLKNYINYDRSFPDAQGRYELSKPVFYHNPQVKLYFDQPYINAMYNDWAGYEGLPAISSKLELQLLDPAGTPLTQQLVWEPVQEIPIDGTNYSSLPRDQQLIYLFNQAASHGGCNPMTNGLVKKLTQGSYQFPDLVPATLYTAQFNAVYQLSGGDPDSVEVHRFGFITSRYATFQEQAGSYVLDTTPGAEKYVLHTQPTAFDDAYIEDTLKTLINDDLTDDPDAVMKYAVPYERLVYGGLKLAAPEPLGTTAIRLIMNTDPADEPIRRLLGVLVYNPEPFNDPRLPAESVPNTIQLTLRLPDDTTVPPESFISIYARDNSAVFITNAAMDIPLGALQLSFRYKIFNGIDYETAFEAYDGPAIDLSPWF